MLHRQTKYKTRRWGAQYVAYRLLNFWRKKFLEGKLAIAATLTAVSMIESVKLASVLTSRAFFMGWFKTLHIQIHICIYELTPFKRFRSNVVHGFVVCRSSSKWEVIHWIWKLLTTVFWRFSNDLSIVTQNIPLNVLYWHAA